MKTHSYRSRSMNKKSKKIYLILAAVAVVIAAGVILLLFLNGYFYQRRDVQLRKPPVSADFLDAASTSQIIPSDMLSKTVSLLAGQTKTSPFVVNWYAIPGSIANIPALQSGYLMASDQILLMRDYIKYGNKDKAAQMIKAIDRTFTDANGYLVPFIKVSDLASLSQPQPRFGGNEAFDELPSETGVSMEATTEYLRAQLEYYDKWGQPSDWKRIEKTAGLLYYKDAVFPEDMIITEALPSGAPIQNNKDIISVIPDEVPKAGSFTALALPALDLEVFRMLGAVDSKYQPLYDKALSLLSGAAISESLPLYSIGYAQSTSGYINFTGADARVDLIPSLKVILHLAEEGKAPSSSLLWIKEQIINEKTLYSAYDILSGTPTATEQMDAYGIVLQIARATDDADLYQQTLICLQRHLATSITSDAKDTIFRKPDDARIVVYAKDNLEALLGA